MKETELLSCCADHFTRRHFFRAGALSFLGINLSQYLCLKNLMATTGVEPDRQARAEACILLFLDGGPSHVDTWDPKPNSSFKPIRTNVPGIQISELFPRLAQRMDKMAIIRSMRTEEIDHGPGTHYAMTGHRRSTATQFPSLGSIVARETQPRNDIPPYVVTPPVLYPYAFTSGFIGPKYDPLVVPDPSQEAFEIADLSLPKSVSREAVEERRLFLKIVDRLYRDKERGAELSHQFGKMDIFVQQALELILSPHVKTAFDLSQESEKTKDAYGRGRFGQSVLLARRLVEAGCRFVTAEGYGVDGWDTHSKNDESLRDKLASPLDQALSTLLLDLDERGLLESTLIIVMGEFGRTPNINHNKGRDHWPHCWSLLLGGGGIRGGQVVGASDERGAEVTERVVTIGDLFATIYKALGIDWTKTYMSSGGRPIYIANSIGDKLGEPLKELI